jgi:glucose/arabinose dehydrogenase
MNKKIAIFVFTILLIIILGYLSKDKIVSSFFKPSDSTITTGLAVQELSNQDTELPDMEVIAEDLEIPWEVAFLPSGEILITERPGRLLIIGDDRNVIPIEGVEHVGEGGLLGLTLHPDFANNNWVYLYLTTLQGDSLVNRVERYRLQNNRLSDRQVIVDNIPGARNHDGGRIEFGPDGFLYISTGDAGNTDQAQNNQSLHGTILRVSDDGSIPQDNPFNSVVFSYGHRNVQGLAWDDQANLWTTEHGRSGVRSGFDELNLIKAGQNYGWPVIEGDRQQAGMIKPVLHSGADETWAPGDIAYYQGKLFFTGLRGASLYEVILDGEKVGAIKRHFSGEFGRLRAARIYGDYIYLTTSNRDGRGVQNDGDDKLIRIKLSLFEEN